MRNIQPIYGKLQRCRQKFIHKDRQNFRESTLEDSLIVHGDTKKDKFTLMKRYGTIASRVTQRISIAAGLYTSTGVSYGLWTFCPWSRASCVQPPARQFVEYFIKKWPKKWLFKTFNIEKNNRQTYRKQAVILCVMSIISTKKRVLNDKNHHFAGLPTCLCPAKA